MAVLWKVVLTLFVCYIIVWRKTVRANIDSNSTLACESINANRARRRRQIQGSYPYQYGYGIQSGLKYPNVGKDQRNYGQYTQYVQLPGQYSSYYDQNSGYGSANYANRPVGPFGNYRPAEYNFDNGYYWYWNGGQKQTSVNIFTILLSLFLTLVIYLITV